MITNTLDRMCYNRKIVDGHYSDESYGSGTYCWSSSASYDCGLWTWEYKDETPGFREHDYCKECSYCRRWFYSEGESVENIKFGNEHLTYAEGE